MAGVFLVGLSLPMALARILTPFDRPVTTVMGLPLNQMSVMAIVMAFGLLVDDAIVVTEQIHRRWSQGVAIDRAAADDSAKHRSTVSTSWPDDSATAAM